MNLATHETPIQPPFPEIPLWSENFAIAGFDSASKVGLWLHLGRWRHDIRIWRELVVIMLPDGTVIAHRGFGDSCASADGPGAGNLAFRVLEPQRRLAYHFSGAARRVAYDELAVNVLQDGPRVRLQFDLLFQSDLPLWDLSKSGGTQDFMGRGHIEQLGRLSGNISVGTQTFKFDAMVNRDHSMGPRDNSPIFTHQWSSGWFDNGIGYMLYDAVVRGQTAPVFSEAAVCVDGKLFPAVPRIPFRLEDPDQKLKNVGFSLEYEYGVLQIETTQILNTAHMCYTAPNEMYIGTPRIASGRRPQMFLEQSALATLNATVMGAIHIERSVPGEVVSEP